MLHATFLRALMLGRPGSPTGAQLVEAFTEAGGAEVRNFQPHGNILFDAPAREAQRIAARAGAIMVARWGLDKPGFTVPVRRLAALVAEDPFARAPRDAVYLDGVTFVPPGAAQALRLPVATARRDVEIFRAERELVLTVTRQVGKQPGNANLFVERLLGAPASTRAWSTIVRLVERHG